MIAYEELDRALARWKTRAQGAVSGVVVEAEPLPPPPSAMDEGADILTPMPIPAEELGSIPNFTAPATERTGEISADELENYDEEA